MGSRKHIHEIPRGWSRPFTIFSSKMWHWRVDAAATACYVTPNPQWLGEGARRVSRRVRGRPFFLFSGAEGHLKQKQAMICHMYNIIRRMKRRQYKSHKYSKHEVESEFVFCTIKQPGLHNFRMSWCRSLVNLHSFRWGKHGDWLSTSLRGANGPVFMWNKRHHHNLQQKRSVRMSANVKFWVTRWQFYKQFRDLFAKAGLLLMNAAAILNEKRFLSLASERR